MEVKATRRRFLEVVAAGVAWAALTGTLGCEAFRRAPATASPDRFGKAPTFRSRPDLKPPPVEVTAEARGAAPGYVFLAPKKDPDKERPEDAGQDGPLILDDGGRPIWFRPILREGEDAMDFKVQRYRGELVLTWSEGHHTGYGKGEHVILDSSYREVARVRAGGGYASDHHELITTPQDTALIAIYGSVSKDTSALGGPEDGSVLEGVIQEIDIATGEVLFEWHSMDHVALEESYYKPPEKPRWPFDYFHINSIDVDHDGNLLLSARRTCAVYKIDRETGEAVWRLGGKKSDFEMAPGTRERPYQHDARRREDGTLTIFDNGVYDVDESSRGIVLDLDEEAMTATLVQSYDHPASRVAATQGNMQTLPNGNVFVGWGSDPAFSESGNGGELLFNASLPPWGESYRAFRFPWTGEPTEDPDVAAERGPDDVVTVHASWNGATEVATWRALAGPSPDRLQPLVSAPREGFETTISVHTTQPYVGVQAIDGFRVGCSALRRRSSRELDRSETSFQRPYERYRWQRIRPRRAAVGRLVAAFGEPPLCKKPRDVACVLYARGCVRSRPRSHRSLCPRSPDGRKQQPDARLYSGLRSPCRLQSGVEIKPYAPIMAAINNAATSATTSTHTGAPSTESTNKPKTVTTPSTSIASTVLMIGSLPPTGTSFAAFHLFGLRHGTSRQQIVNGGARRGRKAIVLPVS